MIQTAFDFTVTKQEEKKTICKCQFSRHCDHGDVCNNQKKEDTKPLCFREIQKMIVEFAFRDRFGGKGEAVKKIPDMNEKDVEKYLMASDQSIKHIESIKIKQNKK